MKRYLFILACLLACGSMAVGQNTTGVNIGRGPNWNSQFWMWQSPTNKGVGLRWMDAVENLLGAQMPLGTGQIFYVDSGVANAGDGSSWTNAKATLAEAIALCTASRGDVIYVAQGHAESLAAAVAVNIAGITIIGCGNGSDMPTFTYTDTDGTLNVTVASVTIRGLRFIPGISAVVSAITLAAGADYFTLEGCEFVEPATATFEFYDMIVLATATDYCTIRGNKFISTVATTGCNQAIDVDTGIVNRLTIVDNEFQGNFAVAAIHSSRVNTNCFIGWNTVHQQTTGQFGIEFTAAATGICVGNAIYTDGIATALDPGSLKCFENYYSPGIDRTAEIIPVSAIMPNYFTVTADMTSATWNTVAAHEIVTVTGSCRVAIMVEVVATIITVGTNGTMALGFAGNTSAIFSATALDTAVTGDVFSAVYGSAATTVVGGAEAIGSTTHGLFDVVVVNGTDIGYTIATNAGTTGSLKFHVWWVPLDAVSSCVAGAGGVL